MDKEKMNETELKDKELEQVSGGTGTCPGYLRDNVCTKTFKGQLSLCTSCSANK